MKKKQLTYRICCLILVLLYSLLTACQSQPSEHMGGEVSQGGGASQQSDASMGSQLPKEAESSLGDSRQETDEAPQTEESQPDEPMPEETVYFTVEPGACLTEILQDLVDIGCGQSVEELLAILESIDESDCLYWKRIPNPEERAFTAEGYIAPGTYRWEKTATAEEVLKKLLQSWDTALSADMEAAAKAQGYTVDEVLIMASIVEWESSFDPHNTVKPQVAAVVRNRIESETALQMDVTIFYLQESLAPYRKPEDYEPYYDTYIRSTLPAGPIGSPSLDSIQAVLSPADTADLFFVYDEAGHYYFAEDYDRHLINCELAGIL